MTYKSHCPFCGAELKAIKVMAEDAIVCPNQCIGLHTPKVWQALIDGKKAQDALKEIKETVDAFKDSEFAEDMRDCVRDVSRIIASIPI